MSQNYYAFGDFPGGDPTGEGLHIGQSAMGVTFLMRSHPDMKLDSLKDWEGFLRHVGATIRAESGIDSSIGELRELVMRRFGVHQQPLKRRWVHGCERPGYHLDPEGVEFCSLEFC